MPEGRGLMRVPAVGPSGSAVKEDHDGRDGLAHLEPRGGGLHFWQRGGGGSVSRPSADECVRRRTVWSTEASSPREDSGRRSSAVGVFESVFQRDLLVKSHQERMFLILPFSFGMSDKNFNRSEISNLSSQLRRHNPRNRGPRRPSGRRASSPPPTPRYNQPTFTPHSASPCASGTST